MGRQAIVAVLAGGRGSRLGGAKAATLLAGCPLISYPLAAARAAGLEAVVVAKRSSTLPALRERVIYEPEAPRHPLCGVLAALDHAAALEPPRAVVLLACDMPFLTAELLAWLADLDGPAIARASGRSQPLLARCMPEQRAPLRLALEQNGSLGRALAAASPRVLYGHELSRFGDPERLCFNVNDAAQLWLAESWLARPSPSPSSAGGRGASGRDPLGGGAELGEAQLRAPDDPAGERRGRPLGGVGGGPGEVEQLADLLAGRGLDAGIASEGGDPFIAGHGSQLSLRGSVGRGLW